MKQTQTIPKRDTSIWQNIVYAYRLLFKSSPIAILAVPAMVALSVLLPPIPGLDLPGVLTSDDLLTGEAFYPRLTIIGGGVIGMEFASLYSALGAEVTVLEAAERILPTLDKELSQSLGMFLKKRGVKLCPGAAVERVERTEEGLRCSYTLKGRQEVVVSDAVLAATGRRANTEELCAPGVDLGLERGAIPVDGRFQTRIPGVYAVGDAVAGSIQLAHAASAQGIILFVLIFLISQLQTKLTERLVTYQ